MLKFELSGVGLMAKGIESFHSERIITIGKVIEGDMLFCCPGAPSSVVEPDNGSRPY